MTESPQPGSAQPAPVHPASAEPAPTKNEPPQSAAVPSETAESTAKTQGSKSSGVVDRFFHISARGSTLATEIRAGVVTFFAMAYIVILNPLILGSGADSTGQILGGSRVAAVTAFAAGVMTIAFGLIAKYPFGIATGLGINTLVAVTFVATEGLTWPEAMGLVVINGIIIVVLALSGFREAVFNSIPASLKASIGVGIGLFIAMIGLVDAGFVRRLPDAANTTVPVGLGINGSLASWPTAVFVIGLIICGAMVIRGVRGGLFIGIILTTIIAMIVEAITGAGPSFKDGQPDLTGWSLAVPRVPDSLGGIPDLSLIGAVDIFGAFTHVGFLAAAMLLFTLVLANFFDAMGTMTALGKQAKLMDKEGNLPGLKRALVVEGAGAVVGGAVSASSNTVYVDSAAGIADGARTGLANVVTGVLFLLAMFLTPLYEVVPIEAAAPVLVLVGAMMMSQITEIDFTKFHIALPAFLTIVVMPFTYSIANGIGVGFIAFVTMGLIAGRGKKIHPLLYVVALLFVVYFAADAVMNALQ